MLTESFENKLPQEGTVVEGRVIAVDSGQAIIDFGFKTEGRVDLKEFARPGREVEVKEGDKVEVYVDRFENAVGEAVLSREKANREAAWDRLEQANASNEHVEGAIFSRVKGGFSVDLGGAVAFLPGSQIDVRPVHDISALMNTPQPFQIVKMDRRRGNIVVSRRAVLEESSAVEREKAIAHLNKGDAVDGIVKNIVDFGAFVDLGGIDGLLHVTDMAWRRIHHPSEMIKVGEKIKVQIIKLNRESQRVSLGMKQLEPDPWEQVVTKYQVGTRTTGRVANITDFGAFVELEPGVEGLIHVSEMSWTKQVNHPGKIVSTSQEVEVMVLQVDAEKRRISLGLKQCLENPWDAFARNHPVGSAIEGPVRDITHFGLFIRMDGEIDGMVHMSDISWEESGEEALKAYRKGQVVQAKVIEINSEKHRVALGIKQLQEDPFAKATGSLQPKSRVTVTVTDVQENGIEVSLDEVPCFIRRQDLGRDRNDQRPDRFAAGERVEAQITSIDRENRKVNLSIKALEISTEEEAVRKYGSSDSGAVLGEILAPALRQQGQQVPEPGASEAAPAPAAASPAPAEADAAATADAPAAPAAPDAATTEAKPEPAAADAAAPAEDSAATGGDASAESAATDDAAAKSGGDGT